MKTSLILILSLAFALAATAVTPAPTTPAPAALVVTASTATAHVIIPAALFQADLAAVPSTAQSLAQQLALYLPLPAGISLSAVQSVTLVFFPNGNVGVTIVYLH